MNRWQCIQRLPSCRFWQKVQQTSAASFRCCCPSSWRSSPSQFVHRQRCSCCSLRECGSAIFCPPQQTPPPAGCPARRRGQRRSSASPIWSRCECRPPLRPRSQDGCELLLGCCHCSLISPLTEYLNLKTNTKFGALPPYKPQQR